MMSEKEFEQSKSGAFISEHYVFHFESGSFAEAEIHQIAKTQEASFAEICRTLKLTYPERIHYYFTDSPTELGAAIWGSGVSCNGCALCGQNKIYAVYTQDVQCIGPHEDAHLISYLLNFPESDFLVEGLAMFFDKLWWGIPNEVWAAYYLSEKPDLGILNLLDNKVFEKYDCTVTYPIAGAFTGFLIHKHGIDPYLTLYQDHGRNYNLTFQQIYQTSVTQLEEAFRKYMRQFSFDAPALERMLADQNL